MFGSPFEFFALAIAIVAFIFARKALNQAAMLRSRLDAIEATGLQARPAREQALSASAPGVAAEQPATAAAAEPAAPGAADGAAAAPKTTAGTAAMPPPLPQAAPGFEERIGTRWWSGSAA